MPAISPRQVYDWETTSSLDSSDDQGNAAEHADLPGNNLVLVGPPVEVYDWDSTSDSSEDRRSEPEMNLPVETETWYWSEALVAFEEHDSETEDEQYFYAEEEAIRIAGAAPTAPTTPTVSPKTLLLLVGSGAVRIFEYLSLDGSAINTDLKQYNTATHVMTLIESFLVGAVTVLLLAVTLGHMTAANWFSNWPRLASYISRVMCYCIAIVNFVYWFRVSFLEPDSISSYSGKF